MIRAMTPFPSTRRIVVTWLILLLGLSAGGLGVRAADEAATPADQVSVPPGFEVELLYSVPKEEQGSWVSLASDPKGRILACDQYGGLYRFTPGAPGEAIQVETLDLKIGMSQGMLYAFDSLYLTVNGTGLGGHGLGFYRLRDTNGDDQFDEVTLLKEFTDNRGRRSGGEHGPHAIVKGPDDMLYIVAGNNTGTPAGLDPESPHRNFAEDHLLPRRPDGRGHNTGVMAPGGWIARTDRDGNEWTLFCAGFRNPYDIAFDPLGELFAYDADMEWDVGAPWYRPTRVNLAVSGAEFGWRYGTGKWPAYYPDSLPAVVDIGLGSPTGVTFGYGARFPAAFQRACFINDWTFGKMYAVHLTPKGAAYEGTFETFLSAKPLPLTDVIIHSDGHMYFAIGGRKTQSGLYRVRYTGSESTEPVSPIDTTEAWKARKLRHELESFHGRRDPKAVETAWPHLNSRDRFLRYAARLAIEAQDPQAWRNRALNERRPTAAIQALLALARTGNKDYQMQVLQALARLPLTQLSEEQSLEALRAFQVAFIRLGPPPSDARIGLGRHLDALYPSQSMLVNRELCQLLTYLESETVVPKTMKLLAATPTQEDQMHFVFVLRNAKKGWTTDLLKAYFSWMNLAGQAYKGGASFEMFVNHIREDADKNILNAGQRLALQPILERKETVHVVETAQPRQYVHNWQMSDLEAVLDESLRGRDFEQGKAAVRDTACLSCHRFKDQGSLIGPDLTGAGNRFSPRDLLESIIEPSKVVSDQYAPVRILTLDDEEVMGNIEKEDKATIELRLHPLAPSTVTVPKNQIKVREQADVSLMPSGLISVLSRDEVLDLIAYLRAGGDPNDAAFKK